MGIVLDITYLENRVRCGGGKMSQEGQSRSLDTFICMPKLGNSCDDIMFYFPRRCKSDTPVTLYHKFLRLATFQEQQCHLNNFAPTCPNSHHNACIEILAGQQVYHQPGIKAGRMESYLP